MEPLINNGASTILYHFGNLALGSLIGIGIKAYFDRKHEKKKLLFEARVKAYADVSGRIHNFFMEEDIEKNNAAKRKTQINGILSATYLLASKKLDKKLDLYITALEQLRSDNQTHSIEEVNQKYDKVAAIADAVTKQMRKDIE